MAINSTGTATFTFPDIHIPNSKKDEDWHKQYVYAIINKSIDADYDLDYAAVESCQNYYHGVQSSREFEFLQYAEDGDTLPAYWINYNKIAPKIDLLLGEIIKKGYSIDVRAINKEAKTRRLKAKEDARVDLRLDPYTQNLENQFGLPLSVQKQKFENEEELEDFYKYSYKENSEFVMKAALEFSLKSQKWDYERVALFRDLIITGRCFSKSELINGVPRSRRIDPKFVIFDRDATDDFLSDATYFGEVRYMSIAEAAQKYDVSAKELEQAYRSRYEYNAHQRSRSNRLDALLSDSNLSFFKHERGELRVLVFEAYWVDYKTLKTKVSVDKYGNEHYKTISDETKSDKNIKSNNIKIWRKAVLIGGETITDWGEIKNQPRRIDDISDTGCPYFGLIPNYMNNTSSSIVTKLKGLQDLKNISMYNLQLSMSRAGAKGFVYDVAQVPDGWDVHTVMKYLKSAGIAFINSRQDDGLPATFNQFQNIDLSLGQDVTRYLEISMMVDREMDQITGINEARQGIVQNASQAVGVTQSALVQSSLTTELYFDLFRQYTGDIFNYNAGLIKIAWPQYKDRFATIIGDEGVQFLEDDVDLDLDDYSIFIDEVPPAVYDTQNLHTMIQAALQNSQINIVDALKLLKEKDIDKGIRALERAITKQKKENQKLAKEQEQQQMMMIQQQQQAAMQQKQMEMQADMQKLQAESQVETEKELLLGEQERDTELDKIAAKLRGDVILAKIKQGTEQEKIQAQINKVNQTSNQK